MLRLNAYWILTSLQTWNCWLNLIKFRMPSLVLKLKLKVVFLMSLGGLG